MPLLLCKRGSILYLLSRSSIGSSPRLHSSSRTESDDLSFLSHEKKAKPAHSLCLQEGAKSTPHIRTEESGFQASSKTPEGVKPMPSLQSLGGAKPVNPLKAPEGLRERVVSGSSRHQADAYPFRYEVPSLRFLSRF